MKLNGFEHYEDFDNDKIFWFCLTDIPQSIVENARQVDGDDYNEGCFGICIGYSCDTDKFCISPDESDTTIYYVNNDGNKCWYQVEIPSELLAELYEQCRMVMLEKAKAD